MKRYSRHGLRQPWALTKHSVSRYSDKPWWALPGPGRQWEGLLSDVADTINNRRAGLSRSGQAPKRASGVDPEALVQAKADWAAERASAGEIAERLGVSKSHVYQLLRQ